MKYADGKYDKAHDVLLFNNFWFTVLDGLWIGYDDNSKSLLIQVEGNVHPYSILDIKDPNNWRKNDIILKSCHVDSTGNAKIDITMNAEFFPDNPTKIPEGEFNSIDEFHLWLELQK